MAKDTETTAPCEEWYTLSLREVTCSFGVDAHVILEIMDEGIISSQKNEQNEFYFGSDDIRRIRTVLQLHRDLGVNFAGAALALELMHEIEQLKRLLHSSHH
ncbi:chaperone modulator CbpM [Legionella erythra]|uniref:Putative chaperone-modulator protein CbpM n=1 Tax=Legionella erythra TaxID=448 RepID=A0A0W0TFL8_LEGER|nr:chaperone modulator CbpM [Legionella erythra]KTC94370.1 putative chaperone-modulator protein CbpM [Legionella erythra]